MTPPAIPTVFIAMVHGHFTASVQGLSKMNSWYLPAIPAALAFAIIGYSLFLAYA